MEGPILIAQGLQQLSAFFLSPELLLFANHTVFWWDSLYAAAGPWGASLSITAPEQGQLSLRCQLKQALETSHGRYYYGHWDFSSSDVASTIWSTKLMCVSLRQASFSFHSTEFRTSVYGPSQNCRYLISSSNNLRGFGVCRGLTWKIGVRPPCWQKAPFSTALALALACAAALVLHCHFPVTFPKVEKIADSQMPRQSKNQTKQSTSK